MIGNNKIIHFSDVRDEYKSVGNTKHFFINKLLLIGNYLEIHYSLSLLHFTHRFKMSYNFILTVV